MKKTLSIILTILATPFILVFGIVISPYVWGQLVYQSSKKIIIFLTKQK